MVIIIKKIHNLNKSVKELKYNRYIDNLTKHILEHKLTNTPITFDNKIKYNESKIAQPITYKFLIDVFSDL